MKKLLDHGYVSLVESWGSDERIIEAARMSTGKGFKGWGPIHEPGCPFLDRSIDHPHGYDCLCNPQPGDEKLLAYLYHNKHATPFEMAGLIIEVKAPIFIFREWHRHRTQSYNEMSARYIPMPDENYLPGIERILLPGGSNKQAQGIKVADSIKAAEWLDRLESLYLIAQATYQAGLDAGVPKELARLSVPVARYSRMMASANLRNWLAFLTLRAHPAAQWEIQQYAHAVGEIIAEKFPRTWALFMEGK